MDDLNREQLRTLAKMTAGGNFAGHADSALEQLARAGLFLVNCYAMMTLAEVEQAEAKTKTK